VRPDVAGRHTAAAASDDRELQSVRRDKRLRAGDRLQYVPAVGGGNHVELRADGAISNYFGARPGDLLSTDRER
jgi:hypothetical protein